jgi:aspartate/methionine/tyrosine aminotransferase
MRAPDPDPTSLFSRRTDHSAEPDELHALYMHMRARGVDVISLTEVNPTRLGLAPAVDTALAALAAYEEGGASPPERPHASLAERCVARYEPDPMGMLSARRTLAAHVSRDAPKGTPPVDPGHLFLTASTSETYSMLFRLLGDPGATFLVPSPSYPLFDFLARFDGVTLAPYNLYWDGSFRIDVGSIERARTPQTRGIIVVSPNNPTGSYLSPFEWQALLDLGLPVIVDEVFEHYDLTKPTSAENATAMRAYPRGSERGLVFSMGGLSKDALLPQWKLAWTTVAGEASLRDEALRRLELLGDTYLSPGVAPQLAIQPLLHAGEATRRAAVARAQENLAVAEARCRGTAVTPLSPQGGAYLVLRVPHIQEGHAWAMALLEATPSVYVHPGEFFGFTGGAYLVLSLLALPQEFAKGLDALLHGIARGLR